MFDQRQNSMDHSTWLRLLYHYSGVIMGATASQITSLTIVYWTVYSGADQRKHQGSASLAFVRGIHQWPVNSPHKWPVKREIFPFDDVIMMYLVTGHSPQFTCGHSFHLSSVSKWPCPHLQQNTGYHFTLYQSTWKIHRSRAETLFKQGNFGCHMTYLPSRSTWYESAHCCWLRHSFEIKKNVPLEK